MEESKWEMLKLLPANKVSQENTRTGDPIQ